jgi:hypothetical protein
MARVVKSEKVSKPMQAKFEAITALTDAFCEKYLNEEYTQLARQATAALCRKCPSPLATGREATWACGIVYALGFVNFLFDKSQDPHLNATELCEGFGVSKSSSYAKSKSVRDLLSMSQFERIGKTKGILAATLPERNPVPPYGGILTPPAGGRRSLAAMVAPSARCCYLPRRLAARRDAA